MIVDRKYLTAINPNRKIYNAKYSEGTHRWLRKYKDKNIKIFWNKKSHINGKINDFNKNRIYSTKIIFCYEEDGHIYGTQWSTIMRNSYATMDYTYNRCDFEDITDFFLQEYLRIGRCIFDVEHINFLLGENKGYVKNEDRFEFHEEGYKTCKWCGLNIRE